MSIHMRVYRRNQLHDETPYADGGVLAITNSLTTMLQGECPEEEASSLVKETLTQSGTVTPVAESTEYVWLWCPDVQMYKRICTGKETFEVDDGGASPVVVDLALKKEYPY